MHNEVAAKDAQNYVKMLGNMSVHVCACLSFNVRVTTEHKANGYGRA